MTEKKTALLLVFMISTVCPWTTFQILSQEEQLELEDFMTEIILKICCNHSVLQTKKVLPKSDATKRGDSEAPD